jgi:hypothetical protein
MSLMVCPFYARQEDRNIFLQSFFCLVYWSAVVMAAPFVQTTPRQN